MYPATVSRFLLDRFEVTVGRFRKFVAAYPGSKPGTGAGAHPLIARSGWDAAWDSSLPADAAALKTAVKCNSTYQTWTDAAAANEHLPMNCLSWYVAFAFCAWDGGRLPTEAEWNYAAAGGGGADGQREYPWSKPPSSTTIDSTYAVHDCMGDGVMPQSCALSDIQAVGSRSPGDGRWGQADLAGNMWEWVLDWYKDPYASQECNDCANLASTSSRVFRGGSFGDGASYLLSSARVYVGPSSSSDSVGARCARTPSVHGTNIAIRITSLDP
jgi:formylglycine-generating enzyme required for sulfatase activity